jgi:protein-S-isoprenylcysteine O-methyltransferase Ste14
MHECMKLTADIRMTSGRWLSLATVILGCLAVVLLLSLDLYSPPPDWQLVAFILLSGLGCWAAWRGAFKKGGWWNRSVCVLLGLLYGYFMWGIAQEVADYYL